MKFKNQYYEMIKLQNKKKAVEFLKKYNAASDALFTKEDTERLQELVDVIDYDKQYFEVNYSLLMGEIQDCLNNKAGGAYWEIDVEEEENEDFTEYFERTEQFTKRHYTVSVKYGEKRFTIAKFNTINKDIYCSLLAGDANILINLLNQDTDINLEKLANYSLNSPKKNPIGFMNALERGVWNSIKKNRVLELTTLIDREKDKLVEIRENEQRSQRIIDSLEKELKEIER